MGIFKGNKKEDLEITYKFTNRRTQSAVQGRQRVCYVMKGTPGPTVKGRETDTQFDAFEKLITQDMISMIVENNNKKNRKILSILQYGNSLRNSMANGSSLLCPGYYLTLDETLYPMRTQICFKQYNPNKPAKYGLLFKSINAARYPFTFVSEPYAGKPVDGGGEYYAQETEAIVKQLVNRLGAKQPLQGRHISLDRLYTSFPLAKWLFEKSMTTVGNLQQNRKGTPPAIKDVKNRQPLSSEIYWGDNDRVLFSYVVDTAKKEKKNVLLLTMSRPLLGLTI